MENQRSQRPASAPARAARSKAAFAAYGFAACWCLGALGSFELPKADRAEPEASQSKLSRDSTDPLSGYDARAYGAPSAHGPAARSWIIPFYIDPAQSPFGSERAIATILRAAKAWEPCGAKFSYQGYKAKPEYGAYGPDESQTISAPIVSFMALPHEQAGLTWTTEADDDESEDEAPAAKEKPADKPAARGQIVRWTIELDLDANPNPTTLSNTAMHEFGHALGMEHSRDRKSIMFGDDNANVTKPTALDLGECRRILSTWSEQAAAKTGMASLAVDQPNQADSASQSAPSRPPPQAAGGKAGGVVPARSSKSAGSSLHAGMSSHAKP